VLLRGEPLSPLGLYRAMTWSRGLRSCTGPLCPDDLVPDDRPQQSSLRRHRSVTTANPEAEFSETNWRLNFQRLQRTSRDSTKIVSTRTP
jgi:hypothetical protein